MATIRHLLTAGRSRATVAKRFLSSSVAVEDAARHSALTPPPPTAMVYDRLAEIVKDKIKRLENPDPRFLNHSSPVPTLQDHTSILACPETRITTLPNGLRVATEANLSSETATIGVWVDAGSRFETDETSGTAHFLEHMIFKGTTNRDARSLEEEIENLGAHLNAYTSREQTAFYAKVHDKHVDHALTILADILQNSTFNESSVEREREVILREMEEVENQTEEVIFDHLHATAFQQSPLARTILGPAENVKVITQQNIKDYIAEHYSPSRMVISASGNVKHDEIVSAAKRLFTKLSSSTVTTADLAAKDPSFFTGSEVRMIDDDKPLAHFAVAFEGASWKDPDSVPLMVIQTMLGSWSKSAGGGKHMGSALAQRVGINEIAENLMSFNSNYKDTGLFGVYAIAKPDCLDDLAYSIMYEFSKICYKVSEEDLIRAQNQLKSALLLHIDGTSPIAEDIGRQLLTYGRRISYPELFARIDAVDTATIKRVANRFIYDKDVAIAALGPIQGLPDYNWFRRRTYWLRY